MEITFSDTSDQNLPNDLHFVWCHGRPKFGIVFFVITLLWLHLLPSGFQIRLFVEHNIAYQCSKFQCSRFSGSNFTGGGGKLIIGIIIEARPMKLCTVMLLIKAYCNT